MVTSFREVRVYRDAFRASMEVFELTKSWPNEERYARTDQIRRSSRSVFANVAEAGRKRGYPKHFASKLTAADAEAAETQTWLDCAVACGDLDQPTRDSLDATYERIIGSLVKMRHHADCWCGPAHTV